MPLRTRRPARYGAAMTAITSDAAQVRGQLLATRLVLQESLDRLPAEQLADLASALDGLVAQLRDQFDLTGSPEQAHIVDEVEAITLRLRYRDQPIEQPAGDSDWIGVCMRCETFPIDIGTACPQCGTGRWVTAVKS